MYLSFIPLAVIVVIAIYYSVVGHNYYSWFEPDEIVHTAYGFEEFINSIEYYGAYLSVYVPILPVCFWYHVFYILVKIKYKKDLEK